jgi:hypothetical protein
MQSICWIDLSALKAQMAALHSPEIARKMLARRQ